VDWSKRPRLQARLRSALRSVSPELPGLRIRGKIALGFALVIAVAVLSMGLAYFRVARISTDVVAHRASVAESDLVRNIDLELVSYRALARYFSVTGKDDDARAALIAEAALKESIDRSMKTVDTENKERTRLVARLHSEFYSFTKVFADIVRIKKDSAQAGPSQELLSFATKELDELAIEMVDSSGAIMKATNGIQAGLLADQQRLESESRGTIKATQNLIIWLGVGIVSLGSILAALLGAGLSRPMGKMSRAMQELAQGHVDVVLPGLGRTDEIGEMATAVEELRVQMMAGAARDAVALDLQNASYAFAARIEAPALVPEAEMTHKPAAIAELILKSDR